MVTDKTSIRAFFAISFNEEIQSAIGNIIQELEKFYASLSIRWIKPQGLHITLQFLKHVTLDEIKKIIEETSPVIETLTSFEIELGQLELFPQSHKPKVISLQVGPQGKLHELSATIGTCMTKAGIAVESRPFRGHITLGRFNFNTSKSKIELPRLELPTFIYHPT